MSTGPIAAFNFVGGDWVGAASGRTYQRENPARVDEVVVTAPDSDAGDVAQAVQHVADGYHEWADRAPEARADVILRAADLLAARAEDLAVELVREEGKTLAEARVETRRTPQNLRMYAGEALRLFGETIPSSGDGLVLTLRQSVGVVAAITPWNFPLNIPSRKLAPALAAGNGVVFKPSELTPLVGQRLVEALIEAGVPGAALALVHGHADVGKALVSDPRVGAVTFTGSTAVGEAIHANVPPWVRTQLEMGGKNALVVLDDADLDLAAEIVAKGAFGLAGQACTGTSRVVVHESVANGLLDRIMERARGTVVGDGLSAEVTMGPLASLAQQEKYQTYLEVAADEGARLETPTHGSAPEGGYFVRPAVFSGVHPGQRLAQEEVFSPILAYLTVASYEEAVEVVNGTGYGLSAGVVTNRLDTALRFARDVDAGVVKVNQPTTGVAMNAPFGGLKRSSTQTFKEQAGPTMMQFYTQEKTVYVSPEEAR
ncbi:aldehyde dehydrogenase family protein [Nocardioides agariphilus]|jgi:aldehyde dehydrogenase (NAD+)|uniref:Aldehyde dehydrogenase family protein n=1 Tax=Nocardioides agariphilus TaxID=433664 RepID=A0A930VK97_9ACTN|nr:aldehyde dehydrogenase family protein [Nocardioides agariphilus]MBF4766295.1 aldehyde dehydrogenase family protein [Nocardioides agariphilus]